MTHQISTDEIKTVTAKIKIKKPSFLKGKDGVQLAYYPFIPSQEIKSAVVFYHAAGVWSMALYQLMAQETCQRFGMAVYLIDIRGHGNSEGPRGDAPSPKAVWDDVNIALDFVKKKHPQVFLLLAGHSSGAGLILNYLSYTESCLADGYVLLAPFLGSDSNTHIKTPKKQKGFITKIKSLPFLGYGLTGGNLCAHKHAVFFNYGDLDKDVPFVLPSYTCAMASALFPRDAKKILQDITKPCALFIGQNDELMSAHKVLAFQKHLENRVSFGRLISKAKHLSLVLKASSLLEEAWQSFLNETIHDSVLDQKSECKQQATQTV